MYHNRIFFIIERTYNLTKVSANMASTTNNSVTLLKLKYSLYCIPYNCTIEHSRILEKNTKVTRTQKQALQITDWYDSWKK